MRFAVSAEQRAFAASLDDLLGACDVPAVAADWAAGDPAAGRTLWRGLAAAGVTGLLVPAELGGADAAPIDLLVAFERLGYHGVPGPWIESAGLIPVLLTAGPAADRLRGIAEGSVIGTVAVPVTAPLALDADVAQLRLRLRCPAATDPAAPYALVLGSAGQLHASIDPSRRLFSLDPAEHLVTVPAATVAAALDMATLACAGYLLGAGRRLLDETVTHAGTREQFGRPIGGFQAVKHALADVRVALDLAEPLAHGAALSVLTDLGPRDVSAAKVAAGSAAYLAARTALQVHGALGYTAQCRIGRYLTKVRALVGAWGTASWHRARLLDALAERAGGR